MELQSWLLYHLVAVSDCNHAMQSAAAAEEEVVSSQQPPPSSGRARDLSLRAQKKLLSRFAASSAGKSLLIDEATSSLLDNLYRLMDRAARGCERLDRRQPEKVLKNVVKLSIKIGLLQRNQQLSGPGDARRVEEVRRALRACAMAVVSFYELDFSFDRGYMSQSLERCRGAVQALVQPHLTDKSRERCDQVFDFLVQADFLEAVFRQDSPLRPLLGALVADINGALESGQL